MKFAHTFNEALNSSEYPPEWIDAAIRYRQLKKCIKKVRKELESLGLSPEMLQTLLDRGENESPGPVKYWFHGTLKEVEPRLVLTVDPEGGIPVDLELEEGTRQALEEIVAERRQGLEVEDLELLESRSEASDESSEERKNYNYLQIPLSADTEFFHLLTSELSTLDQLQEKERESLVNKVDALSPILAEVATPQRSNSRSDLYPWREILRLYADSGIYFTSMADRRTKRPVSSAEEKLKLFAQMVQDQGTLKKFRHKDSLQLWTHFVDINMGLIRLLRFQEINQTAITKILKKFDKRTALNSRLSFPRLLSKDPFFANSISKALCFTINNKLMPLVPQIDDYLCPICSGITMKPIRLDCSHVFCVRCLVKLQRDRKKACPMCRRDCVHLATGANLDTGLLNFLNLYFPKESKEKRKDNEREVILEQFGDGQLVKKGGDAAKDVGCCIM